MGTDQAFKEVRQFMLDQEGAVRIICVDSFRGALLGSENDSETVSKFLTNVNKLCTEFQVPAIVVHHLSKANFHDRNAPEGTSAEGGPPLQMEHLRGSSSIYAFPRHVMGIDISRTTRKAAARSGV